MRFICFCILAQLISIYAYCQNTYDEMGVDFTGDSARENLDACNGTMHKQWKAYVIAPENPLVCYHSVVKIWLPKAGEMM